MKLVRARPLRYRRRTALRLESGIKRALTRVHHTYKLTHKNAMAAITGMHAISTQWFSLQLALWMCSTCPSLSPIVSSLQSLCLRHARSLTHTCRRDLRCNDAVVPVHREDSCYQQCARITVNWMERSLTLSFCSWTSLPLPCWFSSTCRGRCQRQ